MAESKTEKHGPFDVYTEVHTKRGVFGLRPGQTITVTDKGVNITEPKGKKSAQSDEGKDG